MSEKVKVKCLEHQVVKKSLACVCGEIIELDSLYVPSRLELSDERWAMCHKCSRVYKENDEEAGEYDLLGFLCAYCDNPGDKLYKARRTDDEADTCKDCLIRDIERLPASIEDEQQRLRFAKEQLGMAEPMDPTVLAVKIINLLEHQFNKRGMFGVVLSDAEELKPEIEKILGG